MVNLNGGCLPFQNAGGDDEIDAVCAEAAPARPKVVAIGVITAQCPVAA
jgi:hypothetical protein